jgi:ADP-ribose pyrophosphatase YjhB (NUDIX family)
LADLRIREAARALLIDGNDRLLLVRFQFPEVSLWALPGGGLLPGESVGDGLRRELAEELGLEHVEIGDHVWTRLHIIPFIDGSYDGQRDRIHVVRTTAFEPVPQIGWDRLRAEYVHELRWWTVDELDAAGVRCAPTGLVTLARTLLRDGPPAQPIDIDP